MATTLNAFALIFAFLFEVGECYYGYGYGGWYSLWWVWILVILGFVICGGGCGCYHRRNRQNNGHVMQQQGNPYIISTQNGNVTQAGYTTQVPYPNVNGAQAGYTTQVLYPNVNVTQAGYPTQAPYPTQTAYMNAGVYQPGMVQPVLPPAYAYSAPPAGNVDQANKGQDNQAFLPPPAYNQAVAIPSTQPPQPTFQPTQPSYQPTSAPFN